MLTLEEYKAHAVFVAAYNLAAEVHKDDRRDNPLRDVPYMEHIDAVIDGTYALLLESAPQIDEQSVLLALIVAALHAAYEDHPETCSLQRIRDVLEKATDLQMQSRSAFITAIVKYVERISKKPKGEQEYSDYVFGLLEFPILRVVKLADLTHNISALKPGSRRDKYSLTMAILKSSKICTIIS